MGFVGTTYYKDLFLHSSLTKGPGLQPRCRKQLRIKAGLILLTQAIAPLALCNLVALLRGAG